MHSGAGMARGIVERIVANADVDVSPAAALLIAAWMVRQGASALEQLLPSLPDGEVYQSAASAGAAPSNPANSSIDAPNTNRVCAPRMSRWPAPG